MMEISRHTMRCRLISSESLIVVRNDGHPSGNVVVGRSSSSQCPSVSEGVLVANPLTIPTGNCGLATMSVCYMCVKWSFYRPLSYHAVREKAMKCEVKTYIILRLMLFNPITFILSIFLLGRGWSTLRRCKWSSIDRTELNAYIGNALIIFNIGSMLNTHVIGVPWWYMDLLGLDLIKFD